MNRTFVIVAFALVLLAGGVAIFAFFWQRSHQVSVAPGIDNPFGFTSSSTPTGGTSTAGEPVRTITLVDGSTAEIPDMTKKPQPEWASPEAGYEVAGNEDSDFDIIYYPNNAGFSVGLLAEPLKESRLRAEAALRVELKLSDAQLCKLNIEVNTIRSVNETFAGRELGLSFCPNAVVLP